MNTKIKSLKVAILVDPMGSFDSEPEDEIEAHKGRDGESLYGWTR